MSVVYPDCCSTPPSKPVERTLRSLPGRCHMQRKNVPPVFQLTDRSNQELVDGAKHLVGRHRTVTAHLIAHLAEIYARTLHLAEGFSYLGDYCVVALGMSEDEAHRRGHAAGLGQALPSLV